MTIYRIPIFFCNSIERNGTATRDKRSVGAGDGAASEHTGGLHLVSSVGPIPERHSHIMHDGLLISMGIFRVYFQEDTHVCVCSRSVAHSDNHL